MLLNKLTSAGMLSEGKSGVYDKFRHRIMFPIHDRRGRVIAFGGRATAEELNDALSANGKVVEVIEIGYKRNVMAGMKWTNDWVRDAQAPNREFLFLIDKG
mgnify:CR=1 FL=1